MPTDMTALLVVNCAVMEPQSDTSPTVAGDIWKYRPQRDGKVVFDLLSPPEMAMPLFPYRIGLSDICTNNTAAFLLAGGQSAFLQFGNAVSPVAAVGGQLGAVEAGIYRQMEALSGGEFLERLEPLCLDFLQSRALRLQYLSCLTDVMRGYPKLAVLAGEIDEAFGPSGPPLISGKKFVFKAD